MFLPFSPQEADLALVPMAISLERYEAIEFCGYIEGDWTSIVVKYPSATVSFSAAFDVFSIQVRIAIYAKKNRNKEFVFYTSEFFSAITHAQVWIGFLVSGVVVVAFFSLISYLANQLAVRTIGKRDLMNFGATTFYVWSTILSQGLFRFRIARRLKNCNVLLFLKDPIFVLSKRSLNSSQQHGV